jgi:hypothetical protein
MRPLIQFDLTREEIPPQEGHDWKTETPYAADMTHNDLFVTRSGSIDRFRETIKLATDMMELANPDMVVVIGGPEKDENGEAKSVTIRAIDSPDDADIGRMRGRESLDSLGL